MAFGVLLTLIVGCFLQKALLDVNDVVDERGSSIGAIGGGKVSEWEGARFAELRLDRIAGSNVVVVYRVLDRKDAIIVAQRASAYLVENLSINVSRITRFQIFDHELFWEQEDEHTRRAFHH